MTPREQERYYLRILLTKVPGFTSWEDIRTFHGTTYPTHREACLARGLLAGDQDWDDTLAEAGETFSGQSLRRLFAQILCNCNPGNPLNL